MTSPIAARRRRPWCCAYDKQVVRLVAEALGVEVPREAYLPAGAALDRPAGHLPRADQTQPGRRQRRHHQGRRGSRRAPRRAGLYRLPRAHAAGPGDPVAGVPARARIRHRPDRQSRDRVAALPTLEVDFSRLPAGCNPILSFESKADAGFALLDRDQVRARRGSMRRWTRASMAGSETLFARLGLRDYGRFDFRVRRRRPAKLMEVNPNPAWAYDGKLAIMAGFAGQKLRPHAGDGDRRGDSAASRRITLPPKAACVEWPASSRATRTVRRPRTPARCR